MAFTQFSNTIQFRPPIPDGPATGSMGLTRIPALNAWALGRCAHSQPQSFGCAGEKTSRLQSPRRIATTPREARHRDEPRRMIAGTPRGRERYGPRRMIAATPRDASNTICDGSRRRGGMRDSARHRPIRTDRDADRVSAPQLRHGLLLVVRADVVRGDTRRAFQGTIAVAAVATAGLRAKKRQRLERVAPTNAQVPACGVTDVRHVCSRRGFGLPRRR